MGPTSACDQEPLVRRMLAGPVSEQEAEAVTAHLEACPSCHRLVQEAPVQAALEDDLQWADQEHRTQRPIDVNVPLARLNDLLPDYEITEEIGRGGMGIVYEARQVKLNRTVALKVLPALLGAVRPDAVARFQREAELAAGLKHTNIISVHDFGDVDGTLYYTMELIEGRSLRDILQEINETGAIDVVIGEATRQQGNEAEKNIGSRMSGVGTSEVGSGKSEVGSGSERTAPCSSSLKPPASSLPRTRIGSSSQSDREYYRRVAGWFAEVAEALHYAHEHGVIHRDVKPSNLLLAADGRLMISDFGLARGASVETLTATRSLLGTARYMSPEQADEDPVPLDARTDVYALGATLYELLAFRPMFAAADDREVLNQVLNKEPTPPRRFIKQVPRELETICLKAVEKDRGNRYGSAKAFRDDLERWLLDLPIRAKRPSLPARARKFVRRRKALTAAVTLSVVLLIAAGVLYGRHDRSQREAARAQSVARSQAMQLLFQEAHSEMVAGRFAGSLRRIEGGLTQDPDSVELQRLRAKVLRHLGREDEAIECLEGLVAQHPDYWLGHLTLVYAYRELGDQEKVGYHREQVERLIPDTPEALYLRAEEEADARRAIELFNEVLERDPANLVAVMERSRRYYALKEHEAMLRDAERAVGMRPAWAETHGQRGQALLSLGSYEEADAAYGRAIERAPHDARWWHNRALARCKMGRFTEGLADASEAIRLDPDFAWAYVGRARAHAGLGHLDEALADFEAALRREPRDTETLLSRGGLYFNVGRYEDAVADMTRVIEDNPDEPRVLWNRAVAYILMKEYDRAIGDLTRYIALEPGNSDAYANRGHARALKGEYAESVEDYTKAIELKPGVPGDLGSRANLLIRLGRYEEAIADLSRLIDLEPTATQVILQRGMAYEIIDAERLALADYARAAAQDGPIVQYASLWKYIVLRQTGQDASAAAVLSAHDPTEGNHLWTDRLFALFTEELTPEDLLAAAVTDDERAEAYYYIGRKTLLDDRPDDAKDAFTKCVNLDRNDVLETDFARACLRQLDEGRRSAATVPQ